MKKMYKSFLNNYPPEKHRSPGGAFYYVKEIKIWNQKTFIAHSAEESAAHMMENLQ